MKNILFIVSDNLNKPCGGLAERLRQILPLINQKHNCIVFGSGQSGTYKGIPHGGLDTYRQEAFLKIEGPPLQIVLTAFINKFLDEHNFKPDIVVSFDHAAILPGYNIAYYRNSKFIVEFDLALFSYQKQYNPDQLSETNKFYSNFVLDCEYFGIQKADRVILCSEYYRKELPNIKTKHEPIVIANGINVEEWDIVEPNFKFPGNFKNNLLFIGRLHTQKGVQFLLELNLPSDTALHFCGWSVGSNLYEDVIAKCKNVNNMFHLGFLSGENKISAMKSSDAILCPSLHEPFGISMLESCAGKIPLITTRVGGIASFVEKDECIVCEPNIKSIEIAIKQLYDMSEDDKSEMVKKAYLRAKNLSWKNLAEKFIEVFDTI